MITKYIEMFNFSKKKNRMKQDLHFTHGVGEYHFIIATAFLRKIWQFASKFLKCCTYFLKTLFIYF